MMDYLIAFAASFASSVLASLGLGGGSVLLLYLTLLAGTGQLAAQGINLLVFIPVACISLIIHTKNGFVKWRAALWGIAFGLGGVFLGWWITRAISTELLTKAFAVFLLLIGCKELFTKGKKTDKK